MVWLGRKTTQTVRGDKERTGLTERLVGMILRLGRVMIT